MAHPVDRKQAQFTSNTNLAIDAPSIKLFAVPEQDARLLEVVTSMPKVVADERAIVNTPVVRRDLVLVVSEVAGNGK